MENFARSTSECMYLCLLTTGAESGSGSVLRGGRGVHGPFRGGTKITVRAHPAVIAGLGIKLPRGNLLGHRFDLGLGFVQLQWVPHGYDGGVLLQVVEDQPLGVVAPLLASRDRIDRELQTFVGILLGAWLPCLVIDNSDPAVTQIIDAIKSQAPIWKKEIEGESAEWVRGRPPTS